jgi:hypothetical protein
VRLAAAPYAILELPSTLWQRRVIVWDLETVPDLAAAADRILDMPKASDAKLREAEAAKSADKLRASKRGQKAVANPSARA